MNWVPSNIRVGSLGLEHTTMQTRAEKNGLTSGPHEATEPHGPLQQPHGPLQQPSS